VLFRAKPGFRCYIEGIVNGNSEGSAERSVNSSPGDER
jgi:hypothetical protein